MNGFYESCLKYILRLLTHMFIQDMIVLNYLNALKIAMHVLDTYCSRVLLIGKRSQIELLAHMISSDVYLCPRVSSNLLKNFRIFSICIR